MSNSVFLVGLSGSGKTTTGGILAERLGLPFIDTDVEIERRTGRSIPAIFAQDGEPAFRDAERNVIREICASGPAVVSTGGGAPLAEESRRAMHAAGKIVWLDAPTSVLVDRLEGAEADERPLLA